MSRGSLRPESVNDPQMLLAQLDSMFEDSLRSSDMAKHLEPEEPDPEAAAAAAALEAEFNFDNIMAEVMKEKARRESVAEEGQAEEAGVPDAVPDDDLEEEDLLQIDYGEIEEIDLEALDLSSAVNTEDELRDEEEEAIAAMSDEDDGTLEVEREQQQEEGEDDVDDEEEEGDQDEGEDEAAEGNAAISENVELLLKQQEQMLAAEQAEKRRQAKERKRQARAQKQQQQQAARTISEARKSSSLANVPSSSPSSVSTSPRVHRPRAGLKSDSSWRVADTSPSRLRKKGQSGLLLTSTRQRSKSNVSGVVRCGKCNSAIQGNAAFCKHCGSPTRTSAIAGCPGCGRRVNAATAFCKYCGHQFESSLKLSATPSSSLRGSSRSSNRPSAVRPGRQAAALSASTPSLPTSTIARKPTIKRSRKTAASKQSRVIVVGSGSSSGTPSLSCLARKPTPCPSCLDALKPGSKNRRRNPSLLIQHGGHNILIDCGKSFREAWIDIMVRYKIARPDAIIITHAHADAFFGLDDVREFVAPDDPPLPVYATKADLSIIARTMPYLVDASMATGSGYVSRLAFHVLPKAGPFQVFDLKFRGIPVPHGQNCSALGFQFGGVVYLSDIGKVPDKVVLFLQKLPRLDVLFIDALRVKEKNPAHLNLAQALGVIKQAKPAQAFLIGCSHDFHYPDVARVLRKINKKNNLSIAMSYDGMALQVNLT